MRISLLCPTRCRPEWMVRFYSTALDKASNKETFEVVYFIDSDDYASIDRAIKDLAESNVRLLIKERLPKEQYLNMWNICIQNSSGDIFGYGNDDCYFISKNWDTKIIEEFEKVPDKVVLIHGRDDVKNEGNPSFGFIHKNWIDTIGHLFPPSHFIYWYGDTWVRFISDKLGRRIYIPDVHIRHAHPKFLPSGPDKTYSERQSWITRPEIQKIWASTEHERIDETNKLQEFINGYRIS